MAVDAAKVFGTSEKGFARIVIDFPNRVDLPHYQLTSDNSVVSVQFDQPVDFSVPDLTAALPDYVTITRVDPDKRGFRLALRSSFLVNHLEGGEELFIDIMPTTWQGPPPPLPQDVLAKLAERARQAALLAEQKHRLAEANIVNPIVTLRVGRNPTFMRMEFLWTADTGAKFAFDNKTAVGDLDFDWPVPIDLSQLKASLPKELVSVDNQVMGATSRVVLHTGPKVVPRMYALSKRDFIVDIDTASSVPYDPNPAAATTAKAFDAALGGPKRNTAAPTAARAQPALSDVASMPPSAITPLVSKQGTTVRISFPFGRETPAAVFRRGNVVWMLFDTLTGIKTPAPGSALSAIASGVTITPAGDTQVVRIDLSADRLATLGSEGRAWVLSLGDMMLAPTEPLTLSKGTDPSGHYQVSADLSRPGRVHQFADPVVGDTLSVVTAFPPARGIVHDMSYVDFDALPSVHGLVIKPEHDDVAVKVAGDEAIISAPGGLTVSPPDAVIASISGIAPTAARTDFIDLVTPREANPIVFQEKANSLINAAALADGPARDKARFKLAQFYLANRYGPEAIGELGLMQSDLKDESLRAPSQLTLAAADVVAVRPADALAILNSPNFADDVDAKVWRTIAGADSNNFAQARVDALSALPVITSYPAWLRARFLLSAVRAAVETGDTVLAHQLYKRIDFADLDPDEASLYQLLAGRIAEAEGHDSEALDTYGQVIAADIRPTHAEAVYRTILILTKTGRVDPAKASKTLAAEALLWRGDALEASMDKLLAGLYFRAGDYRSGFDVAKEALQAFPSNPDMDALAISEQNEFEALYLNGKADQMQPADALALYYDFRSLTPPGPNGDQMIRNLAQRLVKVDLLTQAAQLLQYQVDNRLTGAARAQVANQLAVIDIANRNPQDALKVLGSTQLADLPPSLDRQRRILQARALIDSNRTGLALDILTPVKGFDADQLRVSANWLAKNYDAVGGLLEGMYAPNAAGANGPPLTQSGRMDIVRAAVGYALAGDKLGLARLRTKFSDALARGPEWSMFDYVTSSIEPVTSPDFAQVAQAVAGSDTLDAFLAGYKQAFSGDAAMTPDKAG
ncbi:MAG TPA: hypothetical protein VL418_08690 [Devosiaceae bacterium]|nr:hypothetical protein [Devosiaceae bacterium]